MVGAAFDAEEFLAIEQRIGQQRLGFEGVELTGGGGEAGGGVGFATGHGRLRVVDGFFQFRESGEVFFAFGVFGTLGGDQVPDGRARAGGDTGSGVAGFSQRPVARE